MNKYLVYTVSDLRESSIKCTHLLYDSLLQKNDNFDFYIITNNINYKNIILPLEYKIIYDNLDAHYIGWLKYTDKLPDNYQYYFYFDSDILCYEKLENLINDKKDISIVKELEHSMLNSEWHFYSEASIQDKCSFSMICGINAGSFIFKQKKFLQLVREKYKLYNITNNDIDNQAKLEQSCFNYTCFDFILNKNYYDITSFVKLWADKKIHDQKIYHFCGWQGFMDDKYSRMKIFHEKYIGLKNENN